jgi:tRNA pseudouridine38-40 synthase
MKFLFLLLLLDSIYAWTAVKNHYLTSSRLHVEVVGNRGLGVPYVESQAMQRLRLLWSQHPFQIAGNLVNENLQGISTGLKRRRDAQGPYDDTLFAALFALDLQGSDRKQQTDDAPNKTKKKSFALTVAYRGTDFCGWQTQINQTLPSVQQSLEEHLAELQKTRVDVRVCGRTDAGVHAIGQVCRFRTALNLESEDIQRHLDLSPLASSFRCLRVQPVSSKFHPGFGATCRAYTYLIDQDFITATEIDQLDDMLQELENNTLDYYGFSYGKVKTQSTDCTLYCARAFPLENGGVCIQIVGDRFLRRMVRILVSTALSRVFSGGSSLMPLIEAKNRTLCAPPAPPGGLIFVGADFETL